MKWTVVPILMLLLLTQTFSKWMWVLDYTINKDYIAANLCENRTRPELKCKGKCQLMKKLAAEEQKENTKPGNNTAKIKMADVVYDAQWASFSAGVLTDQKQLSYPNFFINVCSAPATTIFHPPSLV